VLKTTQQRQDALKEYQEERAQAIKRERQERLSKAKADFIALLKETPSIGPNAKYRHAEREIERDPRFRALREALLDEAGASEQGITERERREREKRVQGKIEDIFYDYVDEITEVSETKMREGEHWEKEGYGTDDSWLLLCCTHVEIL